MNERHNKTKYNILTISPRAFTVFFTLSFKEKKKVINNGKIIEKKQQKTNKLNTYKLAVNVSF